MTVPQPPQRPNPSVPSGGRKPPPDAATMWLVVKATLVAVVFAVVGFAVVVVVLRHDGIHKRHQTCEAIRDGFSAYTGALVAASKEPADSPKVRAFEAEVARRLKVCPG